MGTLRGERRVHPAIRIVLPVGLALAAGGLTLATRQLDQVVRSPYPLPRTVPYRVAVAAFPAVPEVDLAAVRQIPPVPVERHFDRGQTLGSALADLGLDASDTAAVSAALTGYVDVRRIRPGDRYAAYLGPAGRVRALQFVVAGKGRVRLERARDGWDPRWVPFERDVVRRSLSGTVDGSLVGAVAAAGGPLELAYRMADVLQWDIDFTRDLRAGDRFEVAYDEVELDGRRSGIGEVWAVAFDNGGRRLEAYRFGDDGAYYDAEGRPLRKMFLRSPLRFSHVTSRFSSRRLHPVLKVYRPHFGVDYRAAVGTPVRATAGGVVTFAGWSRGGGKMVKVRHPNGYLTAYLHLSRFGAGVHPGRRVAQGDVIAYSGATGMVTAPHLDYRVQKDGRWIDPMSLRNVPAEPIAESRLAAFVTWRDACRAALDAGAPLPAVETTTALAEQPPGEAPAPSPAVVPMTAAATSAR